MRSAKDGLVTLKCGNSKSGYIHIRERHERDWQYFLNKYPIGGTWDDYMLFATKNALQAPDPKLGMPQVIPGDKRCYRNPGADQASPGGSWSTLSIRQSLSR